MFVVCCILLWLLLLVFCLVACYLLRVGLYLCVVARWLLFDVCLFVGCLLDVGLHVRCCSVVVVCCFGDVWYGLFVVCCVVLVVRCLILVVYCLLYAIGCCVLVNDCSLSFEVLPSFVVDCCLLLFVALGLVCASFVVSRVSSLLRWVLCCVLIGGCWLLSVVWCVVLVGCCVLRVGYWASVVFCVSCVLLLFDRC